MNTANELEEIKTALCVGEYSSFMISWNESSSTNYQSVKDHILDMVDYFSPDRFVGGQEEMDECGRTNSIWTAHWYPQTPVGFCVLHASTLEKLMGALRG